MKPLLLDKIGSVTLPCRLARDVRIGNEIDCREGSVIAVRVLNEKPNYNHLELPSGRMSQLKAGDIIAGALGHRKALFGYSGSMPTSLAVGDHINLLNLGGVLGICESVNPSLGIPFEVEVLGQILHFPYVGERIGEPTNIKEHALPMSNELDTKGKGVVAIVGTCMNAGKTYAAAALIQQLTHRGYRIAAGKTTGVSLRRDVLAMEDAGAFESLTFNELGVVTTTREVGATIARTLLTRLAETDCDLIVLELGDGLLGPYGVDSILNDEAVRDAISVYVLAANDPVAAWGGVTLMRDRHKIEPDVLTGPATDNTAGTDAIASETGCPSLNARSQPRELADLVVARLQAKDRLPTVGQNA